MSVADQISLLMKGRRKSLAIMNRLKKAYMKYKAAEVDVAAAETSILAELRTVLVSSGKHQELLGDKTNYKPQLVGQLSLGDGTTLALNAFLQREGNAVAGPNEIREYFLEGKLDQVVKEFDAAVLKIKDDKTKANKEKQSLDFKVTIDDKAPEPELTDQDLDVDSNFTKMEILHYKESDLKKCENNLIKFRYRATGKGPKNAKRAPGKDGLDADLVEGTCVFVEPESGTFIRVRNRNYRSEEPASQLPGGKYEKTDGDYPPLNYTASQIVPGTLQACLGGKWITLDVVD